MHRNSKKKESTKRSKKSASAGNAVKPEKADVEKAIKKEVKSVATKAAPKRAKTDIKHNAKGGADSVVAQTAPKRAKTDANTHLKTEKQTIVKKEPTNAAIQEIPKSKILSAMPASTSSTKPIKPIHYWGGVIYTVAKQRKFRALRERGDRYSECSAVWGKTRTKTEAWKHVTTSIEKYRHVGKKTKKHKSGK